MDRDLDSLSLTDLVEVAMARLEASREAMAELAARMGPSLGSRKGAPSVPWRVTSDDGDVARNAPAWLRTPYRRFREAILGLHAGLVSRPAPTRDGRRRYEGFAFSGKNIIYVHMRNSMILIDFDLPPQEGYPQARVRRGGGRHWVALPVNTEADFAGALELARLTVERASGGHR